MQTSSRIAAVLLTLAALASTARAQTFRTDDAVLRRMWEEGMSQSQTERLAHVLLDSIGPRLSGSPGFQAAADWLVRLYRQWGIEVRSEQYGTWRGWRQGAVHVDLIDPRVQTLEAKMLAWSPATSRPIEAAVAVIPPLASPDEAAAWLGTVRGMAVLASAAEPSCREPQALERLARPETFAAIRGERQTRQRDMAQRLQMLGGGAQALRRIDGAGAAAILTSLWSEGWGVNKIFDAAAQRAVSLDLSCEDFGLLYRLAANGSQPRIRIHAEAEDLGTVPMVSVIAEIRGTELPDEYVMLSAHLDSWHGATGATDNGTGTITMLEAARILRTAYPNPRRTILVGHWGGEEQGLIGSRAFVEDHPDIVSSLQALFNQDNGTWRIEYMQTQGLLGASANLSRWVAQLPTEISQFIKLDVPGPQEVGGSDHVSFLCQGAPGWRLQSHYPDYRQYTWHTNRDTYDKIVFDDLKNNATLAAMLVYLAAEDPQRVPRDRALLPLDPSTGRPREWLPCRPARRSW